MSSDAVSNDVSDADPRSGAPAHSGKARVVALASGTGTVLEALLEAASDPDYPASVVAVLSDRPAAVALDRARDRGIPAIAVDPGVQPSREAWDGVLAAAVADHDPDWVVSAGFMRLLGAEFLSVFSERTINTHPALLPAFPGAHGVRDALAHGVKVSGCTIHLVDSGVDTGPILAQAAVDVRPDDDQATLHERIKVLERQLLVRTVADLARNGYTTHGRRASIP